MERPIEVIQNREKVSIAPEEIYYAEVIRRCCQIHTVSGMVNTYLTISKLAEQLTPATFLQCHRSYIVNLNHVKAMQGNEFVMNNGARVLISRPMKPTVQRAYKKFTQLSPLTATADAREIRLFFAASDLVLEDDFNELAAFVSSLNSRYTRQGVYFSLYISGEGERAEDIEAANEADIFFLIFKDKPNAEATEELEAARRARKAPKIISYHKQTDEPLALTRNIYSSAYTHIDTVKLNIILQLKSLGMENARIDVDGTSLVLEGRPLMSLDNIPVIFNSRDFAAMKAERALLEKEYWVAKEQTLKTPDNKEALIAYTRVSEKKNKIDETIHSLQKDILAMETLFLEKTAAGYISPRLAQARALYEAGDIAGVKKLLDINEMAREDDRFGEMHEEMQKQLTAKVNEYLYLADTLKTDISNPERYTHMERAYEQAVNIEQKFNLDDRTASEKYSVFLFYQGDFERSLEYARRFLHAYESGCAEADMLIAEAYNRMTRCCTELRNFDDAEKYSAKAGDVIQGLVSEEPARFELALADNLRHRGHIQYQMACYDDAGETLAQSVEIYKRLAEANPFYEQDLARVYSLLAILNLDNKKYDKSGDFFNKSIALHEGYKFRDPVRNELNVATLLLNQAAMYEITMRYAEAEASSLKALAIYERLRCINPAAVDDGQARVYFELSVSYRKTERLKESEEMCNKAIDILERLAAEKPGRYDVMLGICVGGQASTLEKGERYDEAEVMYKKDISIYEKAFSGNPEAGGRFLAPSFHGLAGLYKKMGRYDEARHFYEKAITIREQLAAKSPEAFASDLEESKKGLAGLP